jgi:hypothetical protein
MDEKKHTFEDWSELVGTERKLTKEEYEKMLKNQQRLEKIKGVLNEGKSTLGNILHNIRPVLGDIEKRLVENYDSAVGTPSFGSGIREALGYTRPPAPVMRRPMMPLQNPYAIYPYGAPLMRGGPQYPNELLTASQDLLARALGAGMQPQALNVAVGVQQPQQPLFTTQQPVAVVAPQPSPQVVFLFDAKTDQVSEIMNEYPTAQEAEMEAAKLQKQGLPAFYAPKGEYVNKARVKA